MIEAPQELIAENLRLRQELAGLKNRLEALQAARSPRMDQDECDRGGIATAVINAITETLVLTDDQGMVIAVNQATAQRLGSTPEEMKGRFILDYFPPEVARTREKAGRQVLETGRPLRFEDRRGEQVFDATVYPVFNQEGKVCKLVTFAADVTERKRREDLLTRHRDQLEDKVRMRTEELEQTNTLLKVQATKLEEMNAALRVLLEQREHDKHEYEKQLAGNLHDLVVPYLERVSAGHIDLEHKSYLEIALTNLRDLMGSFSSTLLSKFSGLTPREIQVANMVREGKSNKEIAGILRITVRSVEFHRANIRDKLGLRHKRINLRTYLLSLK